MRLIRHISPIAVLLFLLAIPVFATEQLIPNDPGFSQQWYLNTIQAPAAWGIGKTLRGSLGQGSPDTIIAIIDSGVDVNHPDLKGNIWTNPDEIPGNGLDDDRNGYIDDIHGWNFLTNNPDPRPTIDQAGDLERSPLGVHHGTILAGLSAGVGNNGEGIVGVSWSTSIMPLRVIQSDGTGEANIVARAMNYAIDNGANIINLSFVGHTSGPVLERAIQRASDADILIIASAGNQIKRGDGTNEVFNLDSTPLYPICNDGTNNAVIGVTATDRDDKKSDFASYGKQCIDIAAPGEDLIVTRSTDPAFGTVRPYGFPVEGTSMSTALVSGAAALLKTLFPTVSMRQIGKNIIAGANLIDDRNPEFQGRLGTGRLNIVRAIELLQSLQSTALPAAPVIQQQASPVSVPSPAPLPAVIEVAQQSDKQLTIYSYGLNGQLRHSISFSSPWAAMPSIAHLSSGSWVLGAPAGPESSVVMVDARGVVIRQWRPFPKGYRGGVTVVPVGTSTDERIAVTPRQRAGANIKIYSAEGQLLVDQFFLPKTIRDEWVAGAWILEGGRQAVRIRSATRADRTVIVDGSTIVPVRDLVAGQPKTKVLSTWGNDNLANPVIVEGLDRSSAIRINSGQISVYPKAFAINVLAIGVGSKQPTILTLPQSGSGHIRTFDAGGAFQRDWFVGSRNDRRNWQFVFALPSGV